MDTFTAFDDLNLECEVFEFLPEMSCTADASGFDQPPIDQERPGTGSLGAFCVIS
uniref:Pheromone Phb2.2 B1 n=1 Tax=Coprinopsis cinerea TaxID=5346 RepID=Q6TMC3_COPCI|nr:pheromone precursor Phb2.2 B1 [Coprinopsis cinerea]